MLGSTLGGRYKILKHLGQGGFGHTYLAEDQHLRNHKCVVKQLKPQNTNPRALEIAQRLFEQESEVLYKLGTHDQIPQLYAHFQENQEFYLVQEFVEGDDLSLLFVNGQVLLEGGVIKLLQEILKILEFVHQQNVIHRDIKPANLIKRKKDNKIVLIDFGAVKQVSIQLITPEGQPALTIAIGSSGYMPPEQRAGEPRFSSDVYAVGMIGIQALTGLPPNRLPKDETTDEIIWMDKATVESAFAEVLNKMVCHNHRVRYQTATQALDALQQLDIQDSVSTGSIFPTGHSPSGIATNQLQSPSNINQQTGENQAVSLDASSFKPSLTSSRKRYLFASLGAGVVVFAGGIFWGYSQWLPLPLMCQFQRVPSGLFSSGGSTTWIPIRQEIDKKIQTLCPGFQLRYPAPPAGNRLGSSTGIQMLLNNEITFSQSSRHLKDEEYQKAQQKGSPLAEIPIAIDGIAIVVNPGLNIPSLSVNQLRDIYTGKVTNWNQVGGPNQAITPYSRRLEASGTVEYFVENVLGGEPLGQNVKLVDDTTQGARQVTGDKGGIYFASAAELIPQCKIKSLPLVNSQSGKPVSLYQQPLVSASDCGVKHNQLNTDVMRNGDYPLTRQLFVVVKQNGSPEQKAGEAYAHLLQSPQGQEIVDKVGFVKIR